jgi:hypothetical protein
LAEGGAGIFDLRLPISDLSTRESWFFDIKNGRMAETGKDACPTLRVCRPACGMPLGKKARGARRWARGGRPDGGNDRWRVTSVEEPDFSRVMTIFHQFSSFFTPLFSRKRLIFRGLSKKHVHRRHTIADFGVRISDFQTRISRKSAEIESRTQEGRIVGSEKVTRHEAQGAGSEG